MFEISFCNKVRTVATWAEAEKVIARWTAGKSRIFVQKQLQVKEI